MKFTQLPEIDKYFSEKFQMEQKGDFHRNRKM